MNVTKRDGRKVEFNKNKIINAISQAMMRCEKEDIKLCEKIANEIENQNKDFTVEEIQDIVEKKLMASSYKDVAKEYILYREKRSIIRHNNTKIMKSVKEKLEAKNVQNQNANVDENSFGGRVGEATDIILKDYALNNCMSKMSRNNHLNNEIYIHDLNSYAIGSHNCLSIPFDDLLKNGFNTRQTDVRPAQSINTAFQLLAVIFQLQSLQQFGGVSATHLDWTMIPYVRKSFYKHYKDGLKYIENITDNNEQMHLKNIEEISIDDKKTYSYEKAYNYAIDMTTKETYQAVEGMFHNLNTLQSRSGN